MTEEHERILQDIRRIDAMLFKNEQLFDLAVTETDIEALIYEHMALTVRLSALITRAKELGLRGDILCGK